MDTAPLTLGKMELYWLGVVAAVVVGVLFALRPYHGRPWLRGVSMGVGSLACALTPAGWILAPTWATKVLVGGAIGALAPYAWNAAKRKLEARLGHKLAPTIHLDATDSMRAALLDAATQRDARAIPVAAPDAPKVAIVVDPPRDES